MKINSPNKKNVFIVFSFIVFLGIGLILSLIFFRKPKSATQSKNLLPTEVVIPTVDKSVIISLEKITSDKEVVLKIQNAPQGTESIEYTLFYNTSEQGIQGVNGVLEANSEQIYERKITLGTCSSGSCVYHNVVGKIKLNLRFIGNYGEKLFEKEY